MKSLIAFILITGIGVSYTNLNIKNKPITIQHKTTIDSLVKVAGVVLKTGTENEPVYVIRSAQKHLTLLPGNIPAKFKKDNLHIIFSGAIKETHPLEDEYGQLFWLNSIIVQH